MIKNSTIYFLFDNSGSEKSCEILGLAMEKELRNSFSTLFKDEEVEVSECIINKMLAYSHEC